MREDVHNLFSRQPVFSFYTSYSYYTFPGTGIIRYYATNQAVAGKGKVWHDYAY